MLEWKKLKQKVISIVDVLAIIDEMYVHQLKKELRKNSCYWNIKTELSKLCEEGTENFFADFIDKSVQFLSSKRILLLMTPNYIWSI